MVLPPNLLMVEQVPALAAVTVPAAEDRQVVAPWVSVMSRVPVPTVFWVLLMDAVKPENAGVMEKARAAAASSPKARASGFLFFVVATLVDIVLPFEL